MVGLQREVSNIMLEYEKSHNDFKILLGQYRRFEILLKIVAYEASHGMPTGLDFEEEGE